MLTTSKKMYLFDDGENLNVPKKIYIDDTVVEVITKEEVDNVRNATIVMVDALNVEAGIALLKVYETEDKQMKYNMEYQQIETIADLNFE